MPVKISEDKKGFYSQWGDSGHKYYFTTLIGMRRSIALAQKQARAIFASKK